MRTFCHKINKSNLNKKNNNQQITINLALSYFINNSNYKFQNTKKYQYIPISILVLPTNFRPNDICHLNLYIFTKKSPPQNDFK